MQQYKGQINIIENKVFLTSGGLKAELETDPEIFRAYDGQDITVSGEQDGGFIRNATPLPIAENSLAEEDPFAVFAPVVRAIEENLEILEADGVFSARPAYGSESADSPLVPVIRVSLLPGKSIPALPSAINGIKVVTGIATPLETQQGPIPLTAWKGIGIEAKPGIQYVAPDPAEVSLQEMKIAKVTCHVGPDAGWSTLKPFLEGTESSLTVAMYEFYASHIIDTMTALGDETGATLDMILQVTANDKEIEQTLTASWPGRFQLVKAAVSGPQRLFNNSYHTKVAVRDSSALWLSSGNWSPNSQPLLELEDDQFIYRRGNREWHVIIEDVQLAEMYEKFIRYDMRTSRAITQPESMPLLPDLLVPASLAGAEAAVIQPAPFMPKSFGSAGKPIRVNPLMSPDNYAAEILELIEGATTSIYLQFSYVNQPSTELFDEIIKVIAKKIKEGLDVKILVGSSQKADAATLLIARGWKRKNFRKQSSKLHNKGILIDGKIAVVGSNNWSSDGTQYNRDTSLVFYSKPVASYYTEVFMFDWNNLSRSVISDPEIMPVIAPESGPTPLGMVRIPWQAWYDE